jgi:NAD+ kinase
LNTVGFVYNPEVPNAVVLAEQLSQVAKREGWETWQGSSFDTERLVESARSLQMLVTLGGDGTILRVARVAGPAGVPIVGVNLGRLGFLTEVSKEMIDEMLPRLLQGEGWLETRALLSAELHQDGAEQKLEVTDCDTSREVTVRRESPLRFVALNDITISRGEPCRMIELAISIDGEPLTTIRSDGAIIATPTGSTAYSLSAGGPILYPQMENLLFTPLLTHLKLTPPMVLPGGSKMEFRVFSDNTAMLNVDGQIDVRLMDEAKVVVSLAEPHVQFLRLQSPKYFYHALAERIGW